MHENKTCSARIVHFNISKGTKYNLILLCGLFTFCLRTSNVLLACNIAELRSSHESVRDEPNHPFPNLQPCSSSIVGLYYLENLEKLEWYFHEVGLRHPCSHSAVAVSGILDNILVMLCGFRSIYNQFYAVRCKVYFKENGCAHERTENLVLP